MCEQAEQAQRTVLCDICMGLVNVVPIHGEDYSFYDQTFLIEDHYPQDETDTDQFCQGSGKIVTSDEILY